MSAKQVIFHEAARAALQHGADLLAETVRTTLGPKGRNVALDTQWGAPVVSPDGVTVAKAIELANHFENMGAQLLKEAASHTNEVAGDGTTTSTVLAQALLDAGLGLVAAGANPLVLKRGLDKAVPVLVAEIKRQATSLGGHADIAHVAAIAALDDEIGELLATIIDQAGRDAVISVDEGQGVGLEYEMVEGMQWASGYSSPYFITDPASQEAMLHDPAILITDATVSAVADIVPLLEALIQSGTRELLIVADGVTGDALATLVVNKLRGTLIPVAVKAPGFGDRRKALLEDLAVLTGAVVLSEDAGQKLASATLADLGHARVVRATHDTTTIVEGHGDPLRIRQRVAQIQALLATTAAEYDREQLEERAAKLSGGVAVIRVGAPTEAAMKERKARVDDALHATRAAIAEGIVPGGGVAYLNLVPALDQVVTDFEEERTALRLLRHALEVPLQQIADNAGVNGAVVLAEVRRRQLETGNLSVGYDALRDAYGDLLTWGIIDPAKVTRTALENAISVAGMMLTTDVLIAEEPGENDAAAVPRNGAE